MSLFDRPREPLGERPTGHAIRRRGAPFPAVLILTFLTAAGWPPRAAAAATPAQAPTGREQRSAAEAAAREACPRLDALEAAVRADPESAARSSEYRQTVIVCGDHERALAFFADLAAERPRSPNVALNHGYAHVDAIPAAGAVRRVLLADRAIDRFSRAIDLEPSWLALFTRGNAYLYWPKVFGRLSLALADLERAAELARARGVKPYHARGWVALGDAYWKDGRLDQARATWQEGIERFGPDARLVARLGAGDDVLAAIVESELDPEKRVDTDLAALEEAP